MRDHLLGCQAFLPPEPDQDRTILLRKRYPMGAPQRVIREGLAYHRKLAEQEHAVDAFNVGDHTPEHMRNDFPREYDLQTMLNEAARRCVSMYVDFARPGSDLTALMNSYDAEMRRICGL